MQLTMRRESMFLAPLLGLALGCAGGGADGGGGDGADAAADGPGGTDAVAIDASVSDASLADVAGEPPPGPPWYWGDSSATENKTVAFVGYDQGCTQFGDLKETPSGVSFSVGFMLTKPAADRLKHYGGAPGQENVDDGPLEGYAVAGTVLLVDAIKEEFDEQGDSQSTTVRRLRRFVLPPPASATQGAFSGTLDIEDGNPCPSADARCRAQVQPTFVVVWQHATSRKRAYQFIRPHKLAPHLFEKPRWAECPTRPEGGAVAATFHQSVGVYWPLSEDFAQQLEGAPDPEHWTAWIDEMLPR
jgi:hypothetical protein